MEQIFLESFGTKCDAKVHETHCCEQCAQGRGNSGRNLDAHPTVTSKILLPTELDTAMSPYPFRATMTLVMRSGMLVPAARNVRPITSGGMATVSPATFAHQTIRYEYAAIQKIEPMNVMGKNFFPEIERVDAWCLLHISLRISYGDYINRPAGSTSISELYNIGDFTAIFPIGIES